MNQTSALPPSPTSRSLAAVGTTAALGAVGQWALHHFLPLAPSSPGWTLCWTAVLGAGVVGAVRLGTGRFTGRWLTWLMGGLSIPVAIRLMLVADSWGWSTWMAPLAGCVVGFYVLAGAWAQTAATPAHSPLDGEWGQVIDSAKQAHAALCTELGSRPASDSVRRALEERATRLFKSVEEAACSWHRLQKGASPELLQAVETQIQSITQRQADTGDEMVKAEYGRTKESLERQKESIQRIRRGAERALARARHQITVMETARLGVMAHTAQDQHSLGDEAARLSSMLDSASQDLETAAGALEEAEEESLRVTSGS